MSRNRIFPALLLLLFYSLISVTYFASTALAEDQYVSIRLLPEKTRLGGGETVTVGIEQTLHPDWHTYWINPGDSGTAPRITWEGLEGLNASAIEWPVPKRMGMGPLVNFGYEEKVVLLQDLTLPENLPDGPVRLTATVDVLVCHDICIPETHKASMILNGEQYPAAAAVETARTALPLEMGWATSITEEGGNLIVTIKTDAPGAFGKMESLELYPEEWGLIDNTKTTTARKEGDDLILSHPRGDRALSDVPVSKLVIAYEDAAGIRKGIRLSVLNEAAPLQRDDVSHDIGLATAIFYALLGGLILNLMPCVFPVLSMKALSLVQLKDKDNARARLHGIAYTLGVMAMFAVIAGILLALKAGGAQVGWGFQLQHPAVTLFLTYLFFTLGLNLAGYFDVNVSLAHVGDSLTRKSGLSGSFFTGALATLVATPCTAPFMAGAMGYALTQSAFVSMAIFLSLGFGLALPYLALTFIPAIRHRLPRPGVWMERFRQFLAFPMFGAACWLFWVLSQQIDHMGQFAALLGALSIALGVWFWKIRPHRKTGRAVFTALSGLAILFMLSTFFTIRTHEGATAAPRTGEDATASIDGEEAFTRVRLEEYLKGNDPIFVNMTAAWCITCKVNEKVALSIESTLALFREKGVRYLKGDWTNQNPEITNYLEEYGRNGVPIYVYYGPRDMKSGVRPEPVVLPQILTPGIVAETIQPKGD